MWQLLFSKRADQYIPVYTVQLRILNTTNKYHLSLTLFNTPFIYNTLPDFPCIKNKLDLTGLGCATVMFPEAAALCAAQILALNDHVIWGNVRAKQLNTWIGLKEADKKSRNDK